MKKKVKQNYEQMARQTGLRLDEAGGALYGKRGEYSVLVYPANPSYPYILAVSVSAARDSGPLTGEEIKQFKKDNDPADASTEMPDGRRGSGRLQKIPETGSGKFWENNLRGRNVYRGYLVLWNPRRRGTGCDDQLLYF